MVPGAQDYLRGIREEADDGTHRSYVGCFSEVRSGNDRFSKVSAYRIHRDTRFSRNKSPYKTHVAAVFPRAGLGKHEGAAFYLHIAPSGY